MPFQNLLDSGQQETPAQRYQRERQAAFKSAQMALDAITPENEAIVMAILSVGHQIRMSAFDIADKMD